MSWPRDKFDSHSLLTPGCVTASHRAHEARRQHLLSELFLGLARIDPAPLHCLGSRTRTGQGPGY